MKTRRDSIANRKNNQAIRFRRFEIQSPGVTAAPTNRAARDCLGSGFDRSAMGARRAEPNTRPASRAPRPEAPAPDRCSSEADRGGSPTIPPPAPPASAARVQSPFRPGQDRSPPTTSFSSNERYGGISCRDAPGARSRRRIERGLPTPSTTLAMAPAIRWLPDRLTSRIEAERASRAILAAQFEIRGHAPDLNSRLFEGAFGVFNQVNRPKGLVIVVFGIALQHRALQVARAVPKLPRQAAILRWGVMKHAPVTFYLHYQT